MEESNNELYVAKEKVEKSNKELVIAKVKAEESDKLKSVFLTNMSQKIRAAKFCQFFFVNRA